MPISIPQILDLLMALVLIMFIPIGLWRGALREWIALAGITFGYLLAGEWALAWGGDLANNFHSDPKVASFGVAAAFFLGVTLLVGYAGGVTLPYRPDLSWSNRILGALLSLGNGMLILSGTLRIMDRYLFDSRGDSPLHQAGIAGFLIDYIGLAELALLGLLLCCVVIGLLRRWTSGVPLMEEYAPAFVAAPSAPWREEIGEDWALTPPPDEAWQGEQPAIAVEAPPVQQTTILPATPIAPVAQIAPVVPKAPAVVPTSQPASPIVAPPIVTPPPASAPVSAAPKVPSVVAIARPNSRSQPTLPLLPPTPLPANGNGHKPYDPQGEAITPGNGIPIARTRDAVAPDAPRILAPKPPAEQPITCPSCGADIAPRARFCMKCGHIIGSAEQRKVTRLP